MRVEARASREAVLVAALGASIILAALVARALLVIEAPTFRGFFFDDCWPPIEMILQSGKLPPHDACWQCYQPPGVYVASAVAVRAARAVGASSTVSRWVPMVLNTTMGVLLVLAACLMVAKSRGRVPMQYLVMACATAFAVPAVCLAGAGINVDVAPNLLMLAMVCALIGPFDGGLSSARWVVVGVLAGLACTCKYSGMIAVIVLTQLLLVALVWRRQSSWRASGLLLALAVAGVVAAPVYTRNVIESGRLMPGNRGNARSFDLRSFHPSRMRELLRLPVADLLTSPFDTPSDPALQLQSYYRAPVTGFYGLMVTDLEFFSEPGVSPHYGFPRREVPPWLRFAALLTGVPLLALALLGAVKVPFWDVLPAHLLLATHLGLAGLYRVLGGPWFTKAIYNLAIVGPVVLYVAWGMWFASRRSVVGGRLATAAVVVCTVIQVAWTTVFAIG